MKILNFLANIFRRNGWAAETVLEIEQNESKKTEYLAGKLEIRTGKLNFYVEKVTKIILKQFRMTPLLPPYNILIYWNTKRADTKKGRLKGSQRS